MSRLVANYHAYRGYMLHSQRRNTEAEAHYSKAFAGQSTDAMAMCAYGLLLLRKGESQKADQVLDYVRHNLRLNPKKEEYLQSNQGLVYWKLGRIDEALEIYEQLFSQKKQSRLYGTLGFLWIAKGDISGDYSRAWEINREGYDYDDEDPVVLDNLGQLHFRAGEYEKAAEMFVQALKYNEGQFDSLYYLARCRALEGNTEEALKLINKALHKKYSHLNTVALADAQALKNELEAPKMLEGEE